MNSYIPNTDTDRTEMLKLIGAKSVPELFADIPDTLKLPKELNLPEALSEYEISEHMKALASKNVNSDTHACFNGGGIYDHYIPSVVNHISGRQEFYTAYTPYQAEMSQGTLQVIFEYQTMIARLTGMDVSNASMYDGATACAEAMIMAAGIKEKNKVVILKSVNSEYKQTCQTYAEYRNIEIIEAPYCKKLGTVQIEQLQSLLDGAAAVIVQSPNYYGLIEDIAAISLAAKKVDALTIACVDPISLGCLSSPGELGADIVVGEGQTLGNPMNFGGPGFGFFACKGEFVRKMPGRIVGETTDKDGKRGFVLTMQAREQHIRREKSTSNICSNQALCALRATVYLSAVGKGGFKEISELCIHKSHYLYHELLKTGKFEPVFEAPFFKEFVLRYKGNIKELKLKMLESGILCGIPLSEPELENCLLIAVTEKRTKAQMDEYIRRAGE